jgi:hypothetical protein
MNNIVKKLKTIAEEVPIEHNYDWILPDTVPISFPEEVTTEYDKNLHLKHNLSSLLKEDHDMDIHFWIIHEWGGIRSFKRNDRNLKRISEFKNQLKNGSLLRPTFDLMSSLSKIASFMDPKEYAIYDSRAIYALNWLIFTCSEKKQLYPQPLGRSTALSKYDIQTIVRLANQGHTYISHKEAFHHYCTLLKYLSKAVYNDDNLYKIEMLLFSIAPTKIIESIQTDVSINITSRN